MLIVFVQILLKYSLFVTTAADTALNDFDFALLIIATICIAAAGNIINDIYDVEIDKINKPNKVLIGTIISERIANLWYMLLNITGVGLGFYLSNSINKPGFAAIFIIISTILYLYASYMKGILLIGNLIISILVAFSILIVGLFELVPTITSINQASQFAVFKIVLNYAFFAFILTFMREIVKDIQDLNGDKHGGINSLPIELGRKRAATIVFILGGFTIGCLLFYMYTRLYTSQIVVLYFLFLLVAPLLYLCIKLWSAKTDKDFKLISNLLKLIMLLGISSIPFYSLIHP